MLILASASPRRKELLKLIYDDFEVVPAKIDEEAICQRMLRIGEDIDELPVELAIKKAVAVRDNGHEDDIIISCDTGVFIDGEMLGKPKDKADAKRMLRLLSGRKHTVISGRCIIKDEEIRSFKEETEVEFYHLPDEFIDDYIESGEPMDKAGAYGIQGTGALIVKRIEGDYYNVVGLPVAFLNIQLCEMGI